MSDTSVERSKIAASIGYARNVAFINYALQVFASFGSDCSFSSPRHKSLIVLAIVLE